MKYLILAACVTTAVFGQTQLNLEKQGKAVDFSNAPATRPVKTVTSLPASCQPGDMVIKSDAQPGSNLYICTSANTFTLQGGGGSGGSGNATQLQGRTLSANAPGEGQALLWSQSNNAWQPGTVSAGSGGGSGSSTDFLVSRSSSNQLTVGENCAPAARCNARWGETTFSYSAPATVTVSGGNGMALVYLDGTLASPALRVRHSGLTISCSGMSCATESGVAFPAHSIPLATWNATSGTWDVGGGNDLRAMLSQKRVGAGTGTTATENAGQTIIAVNTATVPTYLMASALLDFPAIGNGQCSADLTLSLPGAASGDSMAPGWPDTLNGGLFGMMRVTSAGVIAVRLCNFSGGTVDPVNLSYRATVVRGF